MFLCLLLASNELLTPSGLQSHLEEIQCKIQCRFSTESFPLNCRLSLGYCCNTHFSLESGLGAQKESLSCGWEDSWGNSGCARCQGLLNILPQDSGISYVLFILTTLGFWIISPNSVWAPGNKNHLPVSVVDLRNLWDREVTHPFFQPPPHPCHVVVSQVVVGRQGVELARIHGIVANVYSYSFPVLLREAQIMQVGSNYRLH